MTTIEKTGISQFSVNLVPNTTEQLRSAAVTVIERVWIAKNDPESAKTWLSYLGLTEEINRRALEEPVVTDHVPGKPHGRLLSRGPIKTWSGKLPR